MSECVSGVAAWLSGRVAEWVSGSENQWLSERLLIPGASLFLPLPVQYYSVYVSKVKWGFRQCWWYVYVCRAADVRY